MSEWIPMSKKTREGDKAIGYKVNPYCSHTMNTRLVLLVDKDGIQYEREYGDSNHYFMDCTKDSRDLINL